MSSEGGLVWKGVEQYCTSTRRMAFLRVYRPANPFRCRSIYAPDAWFEEIRSNLRGQEPSRS